MRVEHHPGEEETLHLYLREEEVPIFRAVLERAMFVDTPPQLQSAVMDFLQYALTQIPE